jgi:integrase
MRKVLTDRLLKSLKPAPAGTRVDYWDAIVPGLGARVTDRGHVSFVLAARFPGVKNPTRRAIGEYGAVTLEQAREQARAWLQLIKQGRDPAVLEQQARDEAIRRRSETFTAVLDAYARHIHTLRSADERIRDLRRVCARWADWPISDINDSHVRAVIEQMVKDGHRAAAHKQLRHVHAFLEWARMTKRISVNPAAGLSPKHLIGEKAIGDRVLADDELVALWCATADWGYPYGPLYRLLLLTGLRLAEVSEAAWSEFDLPAKLWVIPASRMKSKRDHAVPLTGMMLEILEALPRFNGGDYLFSFSSGRRPLRSNAFSDPKAVLDARMQKVLGKDIPAWINHDIKRTVRSNLPRLGVSYEVCEAVAAHSKRGLDRVYNRYEFLDEKRAALERWSARIRDLVEPAPENVIPLAARA